MQISETKIEVIVPIITSARTVNGHLETSPVSTTVIVPQQSRAGYSTSVDSRAEPVRT